MGRIVDGPVSAETEVRSTIAGARRLASEARGGAEGANRRHQQTVVLIEIADRIFSLAGALREAGLNPPPLAGEALDALQRNLEGAPETRLNSGASRRGWRIRRRAKPRRRASTPAGSRGAWRRN